MLSAKFLFVFAAVLLGRASAANTIKFNNECDYPIYFWTVGPKDTQRIL
jgi:hypothetical protein